MPVMERRDEVAVFLMGKRRETMEKRIRTCQITVVAGRRRLADPDNICCKFILDSIKGEGGFIKDDNPAVVTSFIVRQEKVGKKHKEKEPYTEIIIEFDDEDTDGRED